MLFFLNQTLLMLHFFVSKATILPKLKFGFKDLKPSLKLKQFLRVDVFHFCSFNLKTICY